MNDQPSSEDYGGPPAPFVKDKALFVLILAFAVIISVLIGALYLDHYPH